MTMENRAREDLRAILAASRELSADHDPQLIEDFLSRWTRSIEHDVRLRQVRGRCQIQVRRQVELVAATLSSIVGLISLGALLQA